MDGTDSLAPLIHRASLANPDYCQQRSEIWFEERRYRVCASDVPALLGSSKFKNPADVLVEKLDPQQTGVSLTAAQQNGIDSEDAAIAAFLASDVGKQLGVVRSSKAGLYVHGFLGASPDAILECADGSIKLLEVKCRASDPNLESPQLGKGLPDDVNLQVRSATGWHRCRKVCMQGYDAA
jgi:predicted phage-related endonuclease